MRGFIFPLIVVVSVAALLTLCGRDDQGPARMDPPAAVAPTTPAADGSDTGTDPIETFRPAGDGRRADRGTIRLNVPPTILVPGHDSAAMERRPSSAVADGRPRRPLPPDGGAAVTRAEPKAAAITSSGEAAGDEPLHHAAAVPAEQGPEPYARADKPAVRSPTSTAVVDPTVSEELSPEIKARLEARAERVDQARSRERDPDYVADRTRLLAPADLLAAESAERLVIRHHGGTPTVTVEAAGGNVVLEGVGTVDYDPTAVHDVNITASGLVRDLYFFEGMIIEKGQPLMNMFAPERLLAQFNHLANISNEDRLTYSFAPGQFMEDSRSNLRWWGMDADDIELLERSKVVLDDYVITAPRSGYVLARRADRGSLINAGAREMENWALVGETVARVADLSRVWVTVELPLEEVPFLLPFGALEKGQPVEVVIRELAGDPRFVGRVDHVFAQIRPDTRRARLRVVLDNPDLRLLPGMYAALSLTVALPEMLRVPRSALLYAEGHSYVLVEAGAGSYRLTRVVTGARAHGRVAVLAGLAAGDRVVERARMMVDPDRELLWAEAGGDQ
ncbi:MAG: efflux RND transporter periplasmic adaptor subunit [Gammaproteobacteria bacterium]|nr:efflux RND transporter periplasmic adaptor subunit [Gammaproteobacteria bacterium]